jgi:hypothetical protein
VKITTDDEIIFGEGLEANEDFSDYVIKKVKGTSAKVHIAKPKVKRPGVHAKTKISRSKNASNYTKAYVSQGR